MLNFQPKKAPKAGGFTLDPVARERARAPLSRRSHFHLLFLAGVIIITVLLVVSFMDRLRDSLAPVTKQLNNELPMPPMAKPSIADLPPLPDQAAIAEQRAGVSEQLANGTVPLWIGQPDAGALAWVATVLANDLAAPPLPQRVEPRDLMLRHVRVGDNVVISGMLEDSQPAPIAGAASGYQRLLVGLSDGQYLEVLAPESARDLLIGDEVVVVGRYLGFTDLPVSEVQPVEAATPKPTGGATAAPATAPPLTAEPAAPVAPVVTKVEVPLIAARIAAKPAARREQENPYIMRGEWKLPDDIYKNVDDDLLVVETRPYYFTLGQVLLDRTSGNLKPVASANEMGSQIHKEPSKYRGQAFTIRGRVFHAWEDPGVAHDQPFGITRVVRVIMWSEDWGDWDLYEGKELVTKRKLILRAFELAAITHQPLPQPGDIITASGRFLRLRSMEVKPNVQRDKRLGINRQSDRAHTFLFVTDKFDEVPVKPEYDFTFLGIVVVVLVTVLGIAMLLVARRDSQKKDKVFDSVRKLRESRQVLVLKQRKAAAAAAAAAGQAGGAGSVVSEPPASDSPSAAQPVSDPPKAD
jgi:hypothetical protein